MAHVVGLDVGNDASCVALVRKRGVDVIMNKESKRETPAVVSFTDKQRFLGTDAAAKLSMAPKNTPHQLRRLIGKKFADPDVQRDLKRLPMDVTEGPDGGLLIHVQYQNERVAFTPEQLMAMVLVDLKKIAEVENGSEVTDCVVSVPCFCTEAERYAMLNATQIAGLKCLRLMNETTATALSYGIYKTDLPETDPVHVAFVDVGHASTQVAIVSLRKGGLVIRSTAWDRNLGGRDFDEVLYDYFCVEFKDKYRIDVRSNAKASFKLRLACEKMKKILSANAEAPLAIECLMDDVDVKGTMSRDAFEGLCQPLLERFQQPLTKALADAGLTAADISSVEVVGSSTRIPSLARIIEGTFGKAVSRTLNAKECVSRGCALQCAMLSPTFKVREFEVVEGAPYTIVATWEKEDGSGLTSQTLFARNSAVPATKVVSFLRSKPYTVTIGYGDDAELPAGTNPTLAVYNVGPVPLPAGGDKAKVKVTVDYNIHGLVVVTGAAAHEEEPEEVAAPAPAPDAVPAAGANGEAGAAPMDTDAPKDAAGGKDKEKEKKRKIIKKPVPFTAVQQGGLTAAQVNALFERECQMQASDRLQEETSERKNALEAYMYDLRNKMYDALAPFIKDADRDGLSARLNELEDWLYDEGENQTKSVYIAKLDELKTVGGPIYARAADEAARPAAAAALTALCAHYSGLAAVDAPAYAHIEAEEKRKVIDECNAATAWLADKSAQQAALPRWQDPVFTAADIQRKHDMIDRLCKPIMSKPAPKPAPPPAAEAAPAPEPMQTEASADASAEASAGEKAEGEPMEQ